MKAQHIGAAALAAVVGFLAWRTLGPYYGIVYGVLAAVAIEALAFSRRPEPAADADDRDDPGRG